MYQIGLTIVMNDNWDVIIIGGGFFGLCIADYLRTNLGQNRILVLEKESGLMTRASYNNQARVHNGYHYPRSLLTALRSRTNFPNFVRDFEPAIVSNFDKYYAIARNLSKVSSNQFRLFCQRIDADIGDAPSSIKSLFDKRLIENVFTVKEFGFNAHSIRDILSERLDKKGVVSKTSHEVIRVSARGNHSIDVHMADGTVINGKNVYNCAYSMINKVNIASGLPRIGLKHELTEMSLIRLPKVLKGISATIMCGPFFSFMPFSSKQLHTLSHVRYTPHSEWRDTDNDRYRDGHNYLDEVPKKSHYPQMIADAQRYLPALKDSVYVESLWEVKTVLPESEDDDSRPILFRRNHGIENYTCIVGGKLDNIYDAYRELDLQYA